MNIFNVPDDEVQSCDNCFERFAWGELNDDQLCEKCCDEEKAVMNHSNIPSDVYKETRANVDAFLKELFEKHPKLLNDPIDCDLLVKRIQELARIKNKQYLDGLNVKMDGKNVLIDINKES